MRFLTKLAMLAMLFPCSWSLTIHPEPRLSSRQSTAKAGLAWANGPNVDINQYLTTGKVSWYYSWSPSPTDTSLEFVPLLWGTNQIQQWQSTINQTIAEHNVTAVLGFNEPQNPAQSNLTAQQGAALWMQYIQPLKAQGIRLGSPAPDSAPDGKTWLQDWLTACGGGCTPDFIALHWYDVNATAFQAYVEDFHATFNLNIWVTEWACQNFNDASKQCSQADIVQFMRDTQAFMDGADYVERYAWFGAMENLQGVNPDDALMTSSGHINALGEQYISGNASAATTSGAPRRHDNAGPWTAAAALAVLAVVDMLAF